MASTHSTHSTQQNAKVYRVMGMVKDGWNPDRLSWEPFEVRVQASSVKAAYEAAERQMVGRMVVIQRVRELPYGA